MLLCCCEYRMAGLKNLTGCHVSIAAGRDQQVSGNLIELTVCKK